MRNSFSFESRQNDSGKSYHEAVRTSGIRIGGAGGFACARQTVCPTDAGLRAHLEGARLEAGDRI
jgi:hypothetical protein